MELLILPISAQRLWHRTAAVLDRALSMMGNPPGEWTIGGGTILAERWAHRDSTDIDLTVPDGSLIQALGERLGGTLREDMYALGAEHVSIGKTRHQVVFRDGAIDIAEMDSRPRHGHQIALLDGRQVRVKSSTQILRGKLERAQRKESPARDLFDIAVAAHAAPRALSAAANMLDPETIRAITAEWIASSHRLNQEASAKLQNISPEYAPEKRELTQRAVARLQGSLYQECRIETERGIARFSAVTRDFGEHVVTAEEGNLREVANAQGIDEFIQMHAPGGAASILDEVAQRLGTREPGTTVLQWSATAGIAYPTGKQRVLGMPDRASPSGTAGTRGPAVRFGKLSPTNGGAIKVYSAALTDTTIVARLLLTSVKVFFKGPLRITKGNFINAPKSQVHGWIRACGRNEADLAGPANDKNTVYARRTGEDTYDLHFVELNHTSTTRADSRDSSLEQPQQASPTGDRRRQSQVTYEQGDAPRRLYSIKHLRESNWRRVPVGPGVYWWYFAAPHLKSLGIAKHSMPEGLRLRRADGKVCLYVGIAASLRQRIEWHAAQRLSQSALRSGTLSTFRFSLLALAGLDYNAGDAEINELMDELDVSWIPTRGKSEAGAIESSELHGNFHFPLNIQGNHRLETADFVRHLRDRRRAYRELHLHRRATH